MPLPQDHISMALFCDFENVALGVRDANYDKFDIKRVLERLLLKGSIVVKKAYCDWERYKGFKAAMHEANFELIEIPHVRQSGKNSADIRLVVDALDLCYTKSHVNTFVIISGDSDFSPLVSKLRENAKHVIGVGVKQSTSDLLIANCDEFIFYDDLVRESQRQAARRGGSQSAGRDAAPQARRSPEEEKRRREEMDARRAKAVEMAAETYEALVTDRDDGGRIWASVLKEAIKRRNPGFSESYYGFRTFGNLLEEALGRGLLDFGRDEKSGTWVARGSGVPSATAAPRHEAAGALVDTTAQMPADLPAHDGMVFTEVTLDSTAPEHATDEGDVNGAVFTSVTVMPALPLASEADADAATKGEETAAGPRRRSRGGRGRAKGGREGGREGGRDSGRELARAPMIAPAPAPAPTAPMAGAVAAPQAQASADTAAPAARKRAPAKSGTKSGTPASTKAPTTATPTATQPPAAKKAARPASKAARKAPAAKKAGARQAKASKPETDGDEA